MLKNLSTKARTAFILGSMSIGQAFAALPADVTDAVDAAKTDGLTVAGGFVAAIIVISALLVARRGARG